MNIFFSLINFPESSFCFVERRRGAAGLEDEGQGLHGGGAMCFFDCESLTPGSGTSDFDGQKAASHKSARAPRRVPRGGGGGREDGLWMVDSDGDDDVVLSLFCFFHICGLGAYRREFQFWTD